MKNICKYSVIALCILASVMTTGCIGKKKTIDESSNTKQAYNKFKGIACRFFCRKNPFKERMI